MTTTIRTRLRIESGSGTVHRAECTHPLAIEQLPQRSSVGTFVPFGLLRDGQTQRISNDPARITDQLGSQLGWPRYGRARTRFARRRDAAERQTTANIEPHIVASAR